MKSRARIANGRWTRNVPWGNSSGVWRTDMFKSVLADERLTEAVFVCKGGPTVVIPVSDMRRVLPLGSDHYFESQIWGPFNIDTKRSQIDGHPVTMSFE